MQWLGFSYIAFRLMHILRERSNPRFPKLTLRETINYVIFFPSFTAGPIDRADRFVKDTRAPLAESAPDVVEGGRRIVVGAFKKIRHRRYVSHHLLERTQRGASPLSILAVDLCSTLSRCESILTSAATPILPLGWGAS